MPANSFRSDNERELSKLARGLGFGPVYWNSCYMLDGGARLGRTRKEAEESLRWLAGKRKVSEGRAPGAAT